jgi:hypothetical protein
MIHRYAPESEQPVALRFLWLIHYDLSVIDRQKGIFKPEGNPPTGEPMGGAFDFQPRIRDVGK